MLCLIWFVPKSLFSYFWNLNTWKWKNTQEMFPISESWRKNKYVENHPIFTELMKAHNFLITYTYF